MGASTATWWRTRDTEERAGRKGVILLNKIYWPEHFFISNLRPFFIFLTGLLTSSEENINKILNSTTVMGHQTEQTTNSIVAC